MSGYRIRPAAEADLPQLRRWRAAPHVIRWWGEPDDEPPEETLAEPGVACWIVELDGRAFAFVQDYPVHHEAPHPFDDLPPGSRGLDLYIGEPDLVGAGHGPRLIRQHVDELFRRGAPAVGADPHPDNAAALAAFRKAGFALRRGPVETPWGPVVLMERRALDTEGAPDFTTAGPVVERSEDR